jgi:LPXTG-site transpeptidase (sortase) family protein
MNINRILNQVWQNKATFLATFFLVFLASYIVLVALDFVPEPKAMELEQPLPTTDEDLFIEQTADNGFNLPVGSVEEPALPSAIYIKKLDRTIPVLNPDSREVADLDAALLNGVVRHPDSATLSQNGNVFILGHSSYLPTVLNKHFQAFNGIQDLKWGDIIEVTSAGNIYTYEVDKVFKASANNLTVPIAGDDRRLTLATCNSFGSTDDRFIVEAKAVDVRPL